jgi:hypothetical protein
MEGDEVMRTKSILTIVSVGLTLIFFSGNLVASPVDLSTFTAYPESAVLFFDEGFSATISEDGGDGRVNPVSLENSSFQIPEDALSLVFDYNFHVAGGNRDFFDFYIGDLTKPIFEAGGSGQFTDSGHFAYDFSGLAGSTVPVVFHLMSDWGDEDFNSHVTISNVYISRITIPGTLLLLAGGFLSMIGLRRKISG